MKKNIGKTEKAIRFLLGAVIAAVGIYFKSWWALVAIVPMMTAFFLFVHCIQPWELIPVERMLFNLKS